MKKILVILFFGISLFSAGQQSGGSLLKQTPTEAIAYEYFRVEILHKEFPKIKEFMFFNKIKSEKNFAYSVCNPNSSTPIAFSAPYDFSDAKSSFPSATNKNAEVYWSELLSDNNIVPVVISLKSKSTKLFFTILVDTTKKQVTKHCSTPIHQPKLFLDKDYEKNAAQERITVRAPGLYRGLTGKEPVQKANSIIMSPKKMKGETFYSCENCKQLFGNDFIKNRAISDGENFYYSYSDDFLLKYYFSKVEFIGDYMYFLTFSQAFNGVGGKSLSVLERISKYVNYDGVNATEVLTKDLLEKIIVDDKELLTKFRSDSQKSKKLKQYLIEYYDRKKK